MFFITKVRSRWFVLDEEGCFVRPKIGFRTKREALAARATLIGQAQE